MCKSQVTQKPFFLTSVEIEKWLCQLTSFTGLTCESSMLSLDPKIWFLFLPRNPGLWILTGLKNGPLAYAHKSHEGSF